MTLRHSYAVACLEQGMNVRDLQEALGHWRLETTLEYHRYLVGRQIATPADSIPAGAVSAPTVPPAPPPLGPEALPALTPESVPVAFPAIAGRATSFRSLLCARLRDRFLAVRGFLRRERSAACCPPAAANPSGP